MSFRNQCGPIWAQFQASQWGGPEGQRGTDSSICSQAWRSQFPLLFKARQSLLQPALTPGLFTLKMYQSQAAHLRHDTVQCSGPYQSQTERQERAKASSLEPR